MNKNINPFTTTEDITPREDSEVTKVEIEGSLHQDSLPKINLTPKAEEKEPEGYINEDGDRITVKVVDDTYVSPQQVELRELERHGFVEKSVKVNIDATEEEREAINLHNKEAVEPFGVDGKTAKAIMEQIAEKKAEKQRVSNEYAPKPRKKSSLQFDKYNWNKESNQYE